MPTRHTGQDVSASLLAPARARAEAAALANVTPVEGDAQTEPAPGGAFDAMASRFGAMFFADPVAALASITDRLRLGACLTLVAWAAAAENPWLALHASLAATRLGPAPASDPDGPGPTASRDPARGLGLLARAGLRDVAAEACDVELRHPGGAAALADPGAGGGAGGLAAAAPRRHGADRGAALRGLEEAFAALAAADGARILARVLVCSAQAACRQPVPPNELDKEQFGASIITYARSILCSTPHQLP